MPWGGNVSRNGFQLSGMESQLSGLLAAEPQACFSNLSFFVGIYIAYKIVNILYIFFVNSVK